MKGVTDRGLMHDISLNGPDGGGSIQFVAELLNQLFIRIYISQKKEKEKREKPKNSNKTKMIEKRATR